MRKKSSLLWSLPFLFLFILVWGVWAQEETPTVEPTLEVTIEPTIEPTVELTLEVTPEPTIEVTVEPTIEVTPEATLEPTAESTFEATTEPTTEATAEATLEGTTSLSQGFVGSWLLNINRPDLPRGGYNIMSFFADGNLITAQEFPIVPDQEGMPFVLFRSPGHGAWTSTDLRTAKITFVYMLNDDQGQFYGIVTVNATMRLSDDGQTISGEVTGFITDPSGKESTASTSTVEGNRIVVSD